MKKLTFSAALLAMTALAWPAQAGNFLFHYEANPNWSDPAAPASATLYLTTSDVLNGLGGYDILSVSGTVDGNAVTGLAPNPNTPGTNTDGNYIYDNILFTSGAAFDGPGLVVHTALLDINFGYSDGFIPDSDAFTYYALSADGSTHINPRTGLPVPNVLISAGSATLTAVPEPAAWTMMVAGFGLAGAAMRRRRTAVSFA